MKKIGTVCGRSEEEMDGAQQDLAMQDEVRIAGNRIELISCGSHHVNSIRGFIKINESYFKLIEASKRVTECLLQTSYGITPTLAAAISNLSNVLKEVRS